ncbi:hypothetical protein K503DRAFT_776193, partial [Rhizopogon vinicolor AM-OR11-026]
MNDPFMDTAQVGHRFDRSALGQFESSPPAGYNPHSAPFSEPGSREHSITPATPMI